MAKKLESTFINMVVVLFIVTALAALALGSVYTATKGPIEEAKATKLKEAIANVVPPYDTYNTLEVMPQTGKDSVTFYPAIKDGEIVGTAVKTYTDDGFGGRIFIMVGFKPDGTIINTAVLEHKETPGLGDKMDKSKSDFPQQFMGKNPANYSLEVSKDGGDVDAITAATISSRAFCDAVQRAYTAFEKEGGER